MMTREDVLVEHVVLLLLGLPEPMCEDELYAQARQHIYGVMAVKKWRRPLNDDNCKFIYRKIAEGVIKHNEQRY